MRPTVSAAVLLLTLAVAGVAQADPTWGLIKATDSWESIGTRDHEVAGEIEIHKAEIGGITCLQGVTKTDLPAETLYGVAADIATTKVWSSAGVRDSEVLGRPDGHLDYYQYLDVPGWTGASDRFWFLRGTTERKDNSLVFRWDRMGDSGGPYAERFRQVVEANPKAIEPPVNVGGWSFETAGSTVTVRYFVCSDTGGVLPKAIQYAASKQTLPDTVGDLIREGKKRAGK